MGLDFQRVQCTNDLLPADITGLSIFDRDSGRFVMTPDKGARLGRLASDLAEATGGSLLVTDSPRTPAPAATRARTVTLESLEDSGSRVRGRWWISTMELQLPLLPTRP